MLGFDNIEDYISNANKNNFGSTIGRVSSRISNSTFSIDGKMYHLDENDGDGHYDGKDNKVMLNCSFASIREVNSRNLYKF